MENSANGIAGRNIGMDQMRGSVGAIDDVGDDYPSIRHSESDDIDMLDAESDPTLTPTGSASNAVNEMSSYAEDVQVVYMGVQFPCDVCVLRQGSGFFRKALEGLDGIQAEVIFPALPNPDAVAYQLFHRQHRLVGVPRFIECESHDIFYAVL